MTRLPFRVFVASEASEAATLDLLRSLVKELMAVGRAAGYDESLLPDDAGEALMQRSIMLGKAGAQHMPSITLDVLNGKPFELEVILGEVVRLARAHNVDIPVRRINITLLCSPILTSPIYRGWILSTRS